MHLHANNQATSKALSNFKALVGLPDSEDLHASHLQKILEEDAKLQSAMIDDELAIRFFFIIASNKLLFPSTDNNIRSKDIYLTRDLYSLPGMDWCKAVVDDLRDAVVTWQEDKTKKRKSLPGCAILLIILYLDNLQYKYQITHTETPRARYFHQNVIQQIISADKTKDHQGKVTFGLLQLRNITNTCYQTTQHHSPNVLPTFEPLPTPHFPSMQVELGGLVAQIDSRKRKMQAMQALATFDTKSKKASSYINSAHVMLRDAHRDVIHTLRRILQDDVHDMINKDHGDAPDAFDGADNVDAHDSHNGHNIGSEHAPNVPPPSETRGNHLHSGNYFTEYSYQIHKIKLASN
ncbi:hypothetical protein BAE44_0022495 [Dichanthelium oligosanthes]|uniref:Uncharacterized protein n=1 Tax=Dichanthelium oligosanthes TaxID=888268 RepID=A0A1E5UUJ2_9POAL|nr:hypothetical protein BAE44_0022495 [Dichanthelium oligosanthes]